MSLDMAKVRLTDEEVREASRHLDVARDYVPGRAVADAATKRAHRMTMEWCIAKLENRIMHYELDTYWPEAVALQAFANDLQQALDGKVE